MNASRSAPVRAWRQRHPQAATGPVEDPIAMEVPVALSYNRVSHVVMMATPADIEELAVGFSITEGLIAGCDDVLALRVIPRRGGLEAAMTVSPECFERLAAQRRNMAGRTGCGLCGAETIEQALRAPLPVPRTLSVDHVAVQRAVAALDGHQPLQADTGAAHGAAWCDADGRILALREDVGRHNALDKLIGSLFRGGFEPGSGFVLVSSRASYEMVYKTSAAGIQLLAAVSAPTALALDFARRADLTLVGFARPGRHNVYTGCGRIRGMESD